MAPYTGPNINGTLGLGDNTGLLTSAYSGAFALGAQKSYGPANTTGITYKADFSASRSNSVYTDSGKVYPASLALNFIIKT